MKKFNAIKSMAVAAMVCMSAAAAVAAPKTTKVYLNSYLRPNYAVVSVVPSENNTVCRMEVTSEDGSIVYLSKRLNDHKSVQYLLDIAKLHDGVYNINFTSRKGDSVSKTFVVYKGVVVR